MTATDFDNSPPPDEMDETPAPVPDCGLSVRQSNNELVPFDAQRIVNALLRETRLTADEAEQIAQTVKEQLLPAGLPLTTPQTITAPLIRGLVNTELFERGLTDAYRQHKRLGVPLYDVDRLMQGHTSEHRTAAHGPDGTSLALAESIKREYAMLSVFSETVGNAHVAGDLHIENLGDIDRPLTMVGSVDFIKRYGVRLPNGFAGARPARRPEVLAAHLVKYTAALHGYFTEAIAWDSVNFAIAPLLVGLNVREMKQIAQVLLFELSAPAVARGGQLVRCDLHLDWDCPVYLREVNALGAGGEKQAANYGQLVAVARDFLRALLEVYLEGDGQGLPFTGPRPILHLSKESITSPGYRSFLEIVARAMAERGGVVLAFDRTNDATNSDAFALRYGVQGEKLARRPESWQWRAALLSSVAINLPRLAYQAHGQANGDEAAMFAKLTDLLELAAQASLEKRVFLEKLLARGEAGPLALLAMQQENEPFLSLSWTAHAIGPVGLAELTQAFTGTALGTGAKAYEFATRVVTHLHAEAERLSQKHKVRFLIAESHGLTAPHRFARLDLQTYDNPTLNELSEAASAETEVFYSNALKLPVNSRITLLERLKIEGGLQTHGMWGAASDVWLGSDEPVYERLHTLLSLTVHATNLNALTLAPDFTICLECAAVARGISTACAKCGSTRVEGLAQINNRYAFTATWPQWKLAELRQRRRDEI